MTIKISLLMTGSELMNGDIVDSNSAFLGQFFKQLGLSIEQKITVGDEREALIQAIEYLCRQSDVVFINGGLGPTDDDLTAEVLASASQQALSYHPQAEQHVRHWCQARNYPVNKANLKQALLPASAQIFPDAPGSAPAFYLNMGQCLVIATPGVPSELKHICQQHIAAFLQQRFAIPASAPWQRYCLFGLGESGLQELIDQRHPLLKAHFLLGFRANFPYVEFKLKAQSHDIQQQQSLLQALLEDIADCIIGDEQANLAHTVIQLLSQQQSSISTAESCTGGLIASQLTQIAGASQVFPGSIVSYSNTIKSRLLGVSETLLAQHGAVSEAVVLAMLAGALTQTQSDYAIAVSGIAGPGGGSEDKPVGTVFIAFGSRIQQQVLQLFIPLPRQDFQQLVACIALDSIRRLLLNLPLQPRYLKRWLSSPSFDKSPLKPA